MNSGRYGSQITLRFLGGMTESFLRRMIEMNFLWDFLDIFSRIFCALYVLIDVLRRTFTED